MNNQVLTYNYQTHTYWINGVEIKEDRPIIIRVVEPDGMVFDYRTTIYLYKSEDISMWLIEGLEALGEPDGMPARLETRDPIPSMALPIPYTNPDLVKVK